MQTRFEVTIIKVTDKAICADYEGEEEWLPKSTIVDSDKAVKYMEPDDEVEIKIADWKARQLSWT